MPLLQGRLSGCTLAGQIASRQRADVNARGAPWGRDTVQTPAVTPRVTTAWQPTDTGQVALWLRGDFGVGPTWWNDASGKDLRAYQDFGAPYEPVLDDTTINNQPGARFDGTAYYKINTLPIGDSGGSAYAYTSVFVYQLDSTLGASSYTAVLYALDDEGYSNVFLLCGSSTGYEPFAMKSRYAATDVAVGFGTAAMYDTNGHAVITTYDGVDSTDPVSYGAINNGVAQTVVGDGAFVNIPSGSIGGDATAGIGMVGAIAEIIIFQGELSAGNLTSLQAYLLAKYALGSTTVNFAGSSTATTSSTASIADNNPVAGASTATTSSSAAIADNNPVAGASTATTSSTAAIADNNPVAGASTATTSSTASIADNNPIAGTSATTTSSTAVLGGLDPIAGASTSTTSSTATIGEDNPVAGASTATTSSTATIADDNPIAGSSTATTSSTAAITDENPIAGTSATTTSSSATLGGLDPVAGASTATTDSTCVLGGLDPISGVSTATTSSTASLTDANPVTGASTCTTDSTCTLGGLDPVAGLSEATTSSTASITSTVTTVNISGASTATTSSQAAIGDLNPVAGTSAATTDSTATLGQITLKFITGVSTCITDSTCVLGDLNPVAGISTCTTGGTCALFVQRTRSKATSSDREVSKAASASVTNRSTPTRATSGPVVRSSTAARIRKLLGYPHEHHGRRDG
jgi:hypothetical protein